jgi:hypothetical protein
LIVYCKNKLFFFFNLKKNLVGDPRPPKNNSHRKKASVFSVPDSKNHCSEVSTIALAISCTSCPKTSHILQTQFPTLHQYCLSSTCKYSKTKATHVLFYTKWNLPLENTSSINMIN